MEKQRVIVTGGSGKTGPWIIQHFIDQGYEVINLDRVYPKDPICHTILCDLTDLGQVIAACSSFSTGERKKPVGVVHMAAIPRAYDLPNNEVFRTNVMSTYNILEACAMLDIRKAVIASSESSYGICFASDFFEPRYLPVDEQHPQLPEDSYGLSKVLNEETAAAFHRRTGMQVISLRLGNVLCPEDYDAIRATFDQPETRLRILWSYIDARDIGIACRLGIEKDGLGHEPLVLTANDTSSPLPSRELIERFLPGTKDLRIPFEGRESLMDNRRIKDVLGWEQQHFFEIEG